MLRALIVSTSYYPVISRFLEEGARRALLLHVAPALIIVPGALEIPSAIAAYANQYDIFVALGCVIRGETSHYDVVVQQSATGLTELAIHQNLVIGNGILTVENNFQALHRANPAYGNKGGEAARAALALWTLRQSGTL